MRAAIAAVDTVALLLRTVSIGGLYLEFTRGKVKVIPCFHDGHGPATMIFISVYFVRNAVD